MSFQETELHKLHLRLKALEVKPVPVYLEPNPSVAMNSAVVEPKAPAPPAKPPGPAPILDGWPPKPLVTAAPANTAPLAGANLGTGTGAPAKVGP